MTVTRKHFLIVLITGLVLVAGLVATLVVVLGQRSAPTSATVRPPVSSQAAPQAAADTFTMNGVFDLLVSGDSLADGTECMGTGSMEDIAVGTTVSVYDGSGHLLATGGLGHGATVRLGGGGACKFPLTVHNVPDGVPTYYVEVGTHGEQPVSSTAAHGWVFLSVSNF